MKRLEKGEVQGIVSWNPDRLARNSVDGGKIIYLLDTGELQSLKFPTHWFENTPQGRFMLSIAFGQAKYYVDSLSQNVHRGLKYKIKQGVWPAKAPMGYRNDRNTKSIVVYEPEARPLKKAFELYSTGKYALDDIGAFLFEHGMKNKYSGGQLNDSNLRRVLMRPFYTGLMVFKGEMYEGTHEAIIDKTLFDKVQKVRKQRGYFHQNKSKRYDFAFTGLIKCHYCNCSITAEHRPFFFPRTNHKANYIYYHCTKKKGECCQKGYTREEKLETQFRNIIQSLSVSEAWVDQMNNFLIQDIETQKIEDKNESMRLQTETTQSEQKLDKLLEAYLDTVIDSESYIKKKNELMERKSFLHSKTKELTSENPFWIEGVKDFIDCAQKCAKIARAENNCHDLAIMAKKVGSKYFLKDNTIEFCLNFPYKLLAANGGAAIHPTEFVPTLAFGQSKYYVDSLSENVKRGIRQKLRRGIYPGLAPIGYLNDPKSRTVVPDPKRWKFIQKALLEYSQGKHSMASLSKLMFSWGFTNRFGKPLNLSTIQNFLMNPFYYGVIRYAGEFYEGTHKAMITKSVFDKIQEVLKQRGKPRKKRIHNFPFLGLMKCAECGAAITAQIQKGHHYYNCTKKKGVCSQKYLREEALVEQIREAIRKVAISDLWAKKILGALNKEEEADREKAMEVLTNLKSEIAELNTKIDKLLEAYLENIVSVEEYQTKKQNLIELKSQLKEKIAEIEETQSFWLEPARKFILSCQEAKIIAETQNFGELFVFLKKVGANFLLSDKKVRFGWQEPYNFLAAEAGAAKNSTWSQLLNATRTFFEQNPD